MNYKEREKIHLEVYDHTGIRRSGRSTRIADSLIQELFTYGSITMRDHYAYSYTSMRRHVFDKILRRLDYEHGGLDNFIINAGNLTISIK